MSEFKFFKPSSWATSFQKMDPRGQGIGQPDPFTGKPITQADIDAQVASYGKEKTDPFTGKPVTQADVDAQVDSFGQDDDPFADEPDPRRTLQQTRWGLGTGLGPRMVNPDRQAALREAKKRSNIQKSEPESGLGVGAAGRGLKTGGLETGGVGDSTLPSTSPMAPYRGLGRNPNSRLKRK